MRKAIEAVIILKRLLILKAIKNKNGKIIMLAVWKLSANKKNKMLFSHLFSLKEYILIKPSPTALAVLAVCMSNWIKIGKNISADKKGFGLYFKLIKATGRIDKIFIITIIHWRDKPKTFIR